MSAELEIEVAIFSFDEAVYNFDTEQYEPGWVLQIGTEHDELIYKSCKQPGPLMKYALKWLADRGLVAGHFVATAHKRPECREAVTA